MGDRSDHPPHPEHAAHHKLLRNCTLDRRRHPRDRSARIPCGIHRPGRSRLSLRPGSLGLASLRDAAGPSSHGCRGAEIRRAPGPRRRPPGRGRALGRRTRARVRAAGGSVVARPDVREAGRRRRIHGVRLPRCDRQRHAIDRDRRALLDQCAPDPGRDLDPRARSCQRSLVARRDVRADRDLRVVIDQHELRCERRHRGRDRPRGVPGPARPGCAHGCDRGDSTGAPGLVEGGSPRPPLCHTPLRPHWGSRAPSSTVARSSETVSGRRTRPPGGAAPTCGSSRGGPRSAPDRTGRSR